MRVRIPYALEKSILSKRQCIYNVYGGRGVDKKLSELGLFGERNARELFDVDRVDEKIVFRYKEAGWIHGFTNNILG